MTEEHTIFTGIPFFPTSALRLSTVRIDRKFETNRVTRILDKFNLYSRVTLEEKDLNVILLISFFGNRYETLEKRSRERREGIGRLHFKPGFGKLAAISAPIYRRGIVESCAAMGSADDSANAPVVVATVTQKPLATANIWIIRPFASQLTNAMRIQPDHGRYLPCPYTHPPPQFSNPFSRPVKLDVFSSLLFFLRSSTRSPNRGDRSFPTERCIETFIYLLSFCSRSTLSFLILNLTDVGLLNRYVNKRASKCLNAPPTCPRDYEFCDVARNFFFSFYRCKLSTRLIDSWYTTIVIHEFLRDKFTVLANWKN